jgi:hypothetical protein
VERIDRKFDKRADRGKRENESSFDSAEDGVGSNNDEIKSNWTIASSRHCQSESAVKQAVKKLPNFSFAKSTASEETQEESQGRKLETCPERSDSWRSKEWPGHIAEKSGEYVEY